MKAMTLNLAAALRTGQRVDFVQPLDKHGPRFGAAAGRRRLQDLAARWPGPPGNQYNALTVRKLVARSGLTDV